MYKYKCNYKRRDNNIKKIFSVFSLFFMSVFLVTNINGICLDEPNRIQFFSGNNNLGSYSISQINSGKVVYIQSDMSQYPLKIKFFFEGNEEGCFNSTKDMIFKLFSSSLEVEATTFSKINNGSLFEFEFLVPTVVSGSFSSNYIVKNRDNQAGKVGVIRFGVDTIKPMFTQFSTSPTSSIISQGTPIKIEYGIADLNSGLKELRITGGSSSKVIPLNGSPSYSGVIEENLLSTTTFSFKIIDMIGNEFTSEKKYLVDKSAPIISNFEIKEYSITNQNQRAVSFKFKVEDDSFAFDDTIPVVLGDLSAIDFTKKAQEALCSKAYELNKSFYNCVFNNVIINNINETSSVSLSLSTKDSIGNSANATFSTQIYYDGSGPTIKNFFLENSIGTRNMFSAYDDNVKVYLEFTDESLRSISDITIIENFDGDNFYVSALRTCGFNSIELEGELGLDTSNNQGGDTINGGGENNGLNSNLNGMITSTISSPNNDVATCVWDIGNWVKRYAGQKSGSAIFKIILRDKYGNRGESFFNASFDNQIPEITEIQLIETESIKDGLVNSGEVVNFRMFVKDDNLDFSGNSIYGDFSNIDYRDGMNKKAGSCAAYGIDEEDGQRIFQCDFEGIVAENGYIKRDIHFIVIDKTANVAKETYEVEVLKISNEIRNVYKIVDANPDFVGQEGTLYILNPINRGHIKRSSVTAWFEGKIELKNDADSNFELINYELISCDRGGLMPIMVENNELYPNNLVQRGDNETNANMNFALRIDLGAHPNKADLNDKKMKCNISVLKKDEDTLYGADVDNVEKIEFEVTVAFYDLPNENLLRQQAETILDDIDAIYFIGDWFDSTYKIYEYMKKGCSIYTSLNTIIGTVDSIWTGVSVILHATGFYKGVAIAGDKAVHPIANGISSLQGGLDSLPVIGSFCKFVSCTLDVQEKWKDIITFGYDDIGNSLGQSICGIAKTDAKPEDTSSEE